MHRTELSLQALVIWLKPFVNPLHAQEIYDPLIQPVQVVENDDPSLTKPPVGHWRGTARHD
jgi:hypothetical protein